MLYNKSNPIGLDVLINRMQVKLYNKLSVLWSYDLEAFPRCYVNYKDNQKNIQFYEGDIEYDTVLFAEKTKFFFTQENQITPVDTEGFEADVNLFFIIDLRDVKTEATREDYECLNDVVNIVKNSGQFEIIDIDTDFKSIFANTVFIKETDNMQPYYCFKIQLKSDRFETDLKKCTNEQ